MARKKITMQKISEIAGVSKYVVSKTLNGKPGVSETTRKKVLNIAKELGYFKGDILATSDGKRDKNGGLILVVVPNQNEYFENSPYWGRVIDGVTSGIYEKNLNTIIMTENQEIKEHINIKKLIGIICVGQISTDYLLDLQRLAVPIVMIDNEDALIKSDTIFKDNFGGVNRMTKHLIALGHTQIAFVGDINFSLSFYDRWLGFRIACEQAGVNTEHSQAQISLAYHNFENKFNDWIAQNEKKHLSFPTAFVCANDDIAVNTMKVLTKQGLCIPEDCSVTGFDNLEVGMYTTPPISTVQVMKESIGRRAVSKLLWRINHEQFPPEKILVDGDLMIRESVSSPKVKE
ncbi:LacI family transcriptional regulator [Natronobacillus azotifigens]|uniref:LacI family DNA-binding transcriptional regulator n=1 Tax=Natronobacillus azotifigens TaxID=472978 RepID=A0A9J6RBM7_9BACI|nr:LacI family DNA-binding transcriptional regulator [Natronobacillus azotifigens]MCZ0703088.1 LacI family DNA-binding transcriptional regulator [Natronobacillus azotifigens]